MRLQLSDFKLAGIMAAGLLGIAAFIIFGIRPGGFEGQIGWLLALLPGVLAAYPLLDYNYKLLQTISIG